MRKSARRRIARIAAGALGAGVLFLGAPAQAAGTGASPAPGAPSSAPAAAMKFQQQTGHVPDDLNGRQAERAMAGTLAAAAATITRAEVIARAQYWVDRKVPYSQSDYYADPQGRNYRQDCSGYVSMVWRLNSSLTTWTLPDVSQKLASYDDLKPGDMLDNIDSHVVLFYRWKDSQHTVAEVYEEARPGTVAHLESNYYTRARLQSGGFQPYKANNVVDGGTLSPVLRGWKNKATGLVLDSNSAGEARTNPGNAGDYQKWGTFRSGGTAFRFQDKATGLFLDSNAAGSVYTNSGNPGDYQKWDAVGDRLETNFKNRATGLCLDSNAQGSTYALGCNGGDYQKWVPIYLTPLVQQYQNKANGLMLDSNAAGVLVTNPSNDGDYQRWVTYGLGGDTNRLQDLATGLFLDGAADGRTYTLADNTGDYQKWTPVPDGQNTAFRSQATALCLDATPTGDTFATTCTPTDSQKWTPVNPY
ncbi:hypothetical protein [Streptomyces sp. NPDC089919]|uniref:RICIN domain-containing protein n=1 Tax=Streptomyces sp. NPDC089919 TaxID=3155188 RepID=UPI0034349A34